jgi:hypothetical protein
MQLSQGLWCIISLLSYECLEIANEVVNRTVYKVNFLGKLQATNIYP